MKISKTKIALILVALSISGVVAYKYMTPAKATPIDFKDIAVVSTGSIESRIDVVSKIALLDKETLTFKQTGKITALNVTEGQTVKAGTVMASVDTANLDRDIAAQKISLDNARIALKRLYEASDATELLKAKNSLDQSKRSLEGAKIDLDTLGREQVQALQDGKTSISESEQNLDTMNKKLDSMKLDLEYTKKTEQETIAQTKADGDSRIKTTLNNANSLIKDVRDAMVTYKKILMVDDPNNAILVQLGNTQLRSEANFAYVGIQDGITKLEDASDNFNPASASISDANGLANQTEDVTKKLADFNTTMKKLIEASVVGGALSSTILDGYRSSISSFNSKFSGWITSVDNNIRDLATGTTVSTIELSTQSSVASKEASLSSSQLDLLKLQNSIKKMKSDLIKTGLDYDAKIAAKKLDISGYEDAIRAGQATYDDLVAGPKSTEIAQKENDIKSTELNMAKLEATRADYRLIAPVDGVISAVAIRKGQQATTTAGITVENRNIVQLTALVDQTQAVKIQIGMPVKVTFDSYRMKSFDAKVSFVESVPTETSGVVSYTVKFVLAKPDGVELYDAMTASARIITDRVDNVVVAPLSAIQDGKENKFVQVFSSGSLRTQTVKIGKSDSDKIEITEGLTPGQRIVIRPYAATSGVASGGFNI